MQRPYSQSEEETITLVFAKLSLELKRFAPPQMGQFWSALEERATASHAARADILFGFREGLERSTFASSGFLAGYPAEYIAAHCYGAAFATLKDKDTIPATPAPPQEVIETLKTELERAVLCDAEAYGRLRRYVNGTVSMVS